MLMPHALFDAVHFASLPRWSWCSQEIAVPRGETSTSPSCQISIERSSSPCMQIVSLIWWMIDRGTQGSQSVLFLHNVTDIPAVYCEIRCQNCFVTGRKCHFNSYFILFIFPPTEPYFVQAVDYGDFIYFFFREIAMEYNTMGKVSAAPSFLLLLFDL